MIWIDKIKIEGFRGIIKPLTYKFNSEGINLITGPNGSGKSTIVTDAFAWVAWKKLVKKGKTSFLPWPNVIEPDFKGTKVELKWHDENDIYQIIRCNDYKGKVDGRAGKNRLLVYKNNREVLKGLRDKADYQAYIINRLGYSFDLFKSTVLFAQELDRLMEESGPSKKQIFDEAFDSVFIGRAREIVELRYKKTANEFDKSIHKLRVTKTKLTSIKQMISMVRESVKNFKIHQDKEVEILMAKIPIIETELKKLMPKIKELKKKRLLYRLATKKVIAWEKVLDKESSNNEFRLDMEIQGLQEKLEFQKERKKSLLTQLMNSGKCPKCGQRMDKRKTMHLRKLIAAELKDCREKIKEFTNTIKTKELDHIKAKQIVLDQKKTLDKIAKSQKDQKAYIHSLGDLKTARVDRNYKKLQLANLKADLEKLRKQKPPENNLFELLSKKNELMEQYRSIRSNKRKLNAKLKIDDWLMKDPLSNSGLKAFIFDSMLKGVNNHLKAYTHLVKFKIKVYIDMSQATKPISVLVIKNNLEVPYEDLSKGQKQLVHVAIAFALNDVVNDAKPINIMIMDELFESLDPENVEAVWNIILSKVKNKSIHIITHQTQFQPTGAKHIRIIQNEHGQSVIDKN